MGVSQVPRALPVGLHNFHFKLLFKQRQGEGLSGLTKDFELDISWVGNPKWERRGDEGHGDYIR